jgi:hypothetical protein
MTPMGGKSMPMLELPAACDAMLLLAAAGKK